MSAYLREHKHKENLHEKDEAVKTLKALIETHEQSDKPDWIYICRLNVKLKRAEKQREHMRP